MLGEVSFENILKYCFADTGMARQFSLTQKLERHNSIVAMALVIMRGQSAGQIILIAMYMPDTGPS